MEACCYLFAGLVCFAVASPAAVAASIVVVAAGVDVEADVGVAFVAVLGTPASAFGSQSPQDGSMPCRH